MGRSIYLRDIELRRLEEMEEATGFKRSALVRAAVNKLYEEWVAMNRDDAWLIKVVKRYDREVGDYADSRE